MILHEKYSTIVIITGSPLFLISNESKPSTAKNIASILYSSSRRLLTYFHTCDPPTGQGFYFSHFDFLLRGSHAVRIKHTDGDSITRINTDQIKYRPTSTPQHALPGVIQTFQTMFHSKQWRDSFVQCCNLGIYALC